jgi:hypothetical protein
LKRKEKFCPLFFITANVLTLNLPWRLNALRETHHTNSRAFSLPILFSEKPGKQICYSCVLITGAA